MNTTQAIKLKHIPIANMGGLNAECGQLLYQNKVRLRVTFSPYKDHRCRECHVSKI